MAKWINDAAADAALNMIKGNVNRLRAYDGDPNSGGLILASVNVDSSDFTGPANGDDSGRKLTVNEQADVSVTASGEADHVALYTYWQVDSEYYYNQYTTTCTPLSLLAGGLVTFPAWKIEIADPT